MTLESKHTIAIFLQCMSALVEISSPQDWRILGVFIFFVSSFLKGIVWVKRDATVPFFHRPRQRRTRRFAIAVKGAFENQMIFCTTVDGDFKNFKWGIGVSLIKLGMWNPRPR
jgi:hypothetical protein